MSTADVSETCDNMRVTFQNALGSLNQMVSMIAQDGNSLGNFASNATWQIAKSGLSADQQNDLLASSRSGFLGCLQLENGVLSGAGGFVVFIPTSMTNGFASSDVSIVGS